MRSFIAVILIAIGILLAYYAQDIIEFSNSFMIREGTKKEKDVTNEIKEVELNDINLKELLKRPKKIALESVKIPEPTKKIKSNFISRYILSSTVDLDVMLSEDWAKRDKIFAQSQKVVRILDRCLSTEDLCGQKSQFMPGEYFDGQMTPYHRDLNRAIQIVSAIADKDPNYIKQIDQQLLIDAVKIKNADTPLYALEALLKTNLNSQEFEQVIENSKNVTSSSKPMFFQMLAQNDLLNQQANRKTFVDEIIRTLSDKNNLTAAYETQKNLLSLHLNQHEFTQVVHSSCHLKSAGVEGDIWPAVKRQLENQIERSGYNIKLSEICI